MTYKMLFVSCICLFSLLISQVMSLFDDYRKVLNQKSFRWVDLSENELGQWYQPADLCILNSTDRLKFPQDVRADDCYHYSKGSRRQFCGVGMGNNNYPCYGPFNSARKYFKRGVDGYQNADAKPLLSFFAHLFLTNTTFIMLGDSTMRQKLQALQCEITRETNGQAKFNGNVFGILPCDTYLHIYFPLSKNRRFQYPVFKANNITYKYHPLAGQAITLYAISLGPKSVDCYKKILTEQKKDYMDPKQNYRLFSKAEDPSIQIDYLRTETEGVYGNAARYVNQLNYEQSKNVFVFANMGLWYNLPIEYGPILPVVFEWLTSVKKRPHFDNTIAWHETLRQHWSNRNDYSGNYDKNEIYAASEALKAVNYSSYPFQEFIGGLCCSKITNDSEAADWRNEMVRSILYDRENYPNFEKAIHLLPLANITK